MDEPPKNIPPDHSAGMSSTYRAYLIGQNGRVETSIDIEAATDDRAIQQVRDLTRTYEVELWDRSRLIARLPTMTLR